MSFDGLRVLSLESRRSTEIGRLIRSQGGEPFIAPSMREVPLEDNPQVFHFAGELFDGTFDMMIFLTGVGARLLGQVIETRHPAGSFAEALRKLAVVVRGSKPMAVMREWKVPVAIAVPEPNTWREVLAALAGRQERHIAVQEYGRPAVELIEGLRGKSADVTTVPVYQWRLPEDCGPLREAAEKLAAGRFDVVLFTTSMQVSHLLRTAADLGIEDAVRSALGRVVIGSVGPTTTETLAEVGITPDLEPSHPKMGFLVNETAARAHEILQLKR